MSNSPTAISAIFDEILTFRDSQSCNLLSSEEWTSVLKLSTMWEFEDIRARAIKALGSLTLSKDSDLVDKIVIARKSAVSSWLVPSLHALVQRGRPLDLSEGDRLGLEWALKGLLLGCNPNIDSGSQPSAPLIDIQDLAMTYKMKTADRAIYDRILLEREFPPPYMLDVIRERIRVIRQESQDESVYLAAISIFTSSENEAEEMVDLVTQSQYNSLLHYRDECRKRAVAVASPPHNHFTWMSPEYNWFRVNEEHDCNRGGNIFIANVQGKSMMRYWWREYIYEAKSQLAKRPWGATVTSGDFFDRALEDGSRCRVCRKDLEHDFRQFTDIFARQIDDAVSQVRSCHNCLSGNVLKSNFGIGCIRELITDVTSRYSRPQYVITSIQVQQTVLCTMVITKSQVLKDGHQKQKSTSNVFAILIRH